MPKMWSVLRRRKFPETEEKFMYKQMFNWNFHGNFDRLLKFLLKSRWLIEISIDISMAYWNFHEEEVPLQNIRVAGPTSEQNPRAEVVSSWRLRWSRLMRRSYQWSFEEAGGEVSLKRRKVHVQTDVKFPLNSNKPLMMMIVASVETQRGLWSLEGKI